MFFGRYQVFRLLRQLTLRAVFAGFGCVVEIMFVDIVWIGAVYFQVEGRGRAFHCSVMCR